MTTRAKVQVWFSVGTSVVDATDTRDLIQAVVLAGTKVGLGYRHNKLHPWSFGIRKRLSKEDAVLSQREPRDAAVNLDTYQMLQRHRAVSGTARLSCWSFTADCSELSVRK